MKLGAHSSIAGGLSRAIERAGEYNGTAIQIFSKNQHQWARRPLDPDAVRRWKQALDCSPIESVAIHDSYLINLCSSDSQTLRRSFDAFVDEHRRAAELGVRLLNFHPGAAVDRDREEAIDLVAERLNRAHEATDELDTISVIETTAGQGTTLGWRFEEIARIMQQVDDRSRVGVCIDTAHVFAAGYDIRTEREYDNTIAEFDDVIGLRHLVLIHLNDSKTRLGSRVDRHEHIGRGEIGETAFRMIMADERLREVPCVIETPKGHNAEMDIVNIELLRSFIPRKLRTSKSRTGRTHARQ